MPKYSRRARLAELATCGTSAAFNRNLANRLWAHMMGRGLVHPLDMQHSGNPPVQSELLTLLADELLRGSSTSEPVWRWGQACDVTGGPISSAAWHLIRDWRSQWQQVGGTVPTLVVDGEAVIGVDAVDWLGAQLRERGLDAWDDREREHPAA